MRLHCIIIALLFFSCKPSDTVPSSDLSILQNLPIQDTSSASDTTIIQRIRPPAGYVRTAVAKTSFQHYLRTLKLKPKGSLVKYYNGRVKPNNGIYTDVVDLYIGTKDLHQCADAVIRLRAEHLWNTGNYEDIHFNFTNGFRVDYSEWMNGRRMIVNGNTTKWDNGTRASNTYKDFWSYMELIFSYAGTASLEKELIKVGDAEPEIGDILIQGGFPGHAVIIVDKASFKRSGKAVYLLAQSYMPAQEIQILKNPDSEELSPWYRLDQGRIYTPEWAFDRNDLYRFPE